MGAATVVDLEPDDPRLSSALPVLRELRPHLDADLFAGIYAEGHPQGLRFSAVFVDHDGGDDGNSGDGVNGGRCVAVAGWRIVATTVAVRKLYVDDLVTSGTERSGGHGRMLLDHLVAQAAEAGCTALDLDSGTQRLDAHRFYFREGLTISSFHFRRDIPGPGR